MTKASKDKSKGSGDGAQPQVGGGVRKLPSPWAGVAVLVGVAVVAGAAFGWFLSQHQPKPGWIAFALGLIALWILPRHLPGLRERAALRKARKDARRLAKSVRKSLDTQGKWTSVEARERILNALETLQNAVLADDVAAIEAAAQKLEEYAQAHLVRKSATREIVEQIGGAILVALFLRAFFYEAFRIPSASMVPTLLVGDHLFVNKFVYGFRVPFTVEKVLAKVPKRGDIVVFNRPGDEHGDDIIKRVIGLPGDVVRVNDRRVTICPSGTDCEKLVTKNLGTVHLNESGDPDTLTDKGQFMSFELFEELAGKHEHLAIAMNNRRGEGAEGSWTVEPGHVFVMGDNRDNSQDSRFGFASGGFGQVPIDYIKGRADVIWLSIGGPHGLRFDRMFSLLR